MGLVGLWPVDLPGPGIEPMSSAAAGTSLSTVPPEKSVKSLFLSSSQIPCEADSTFYPHFIERQTKTESGEITFPRSYNNVIELGF